MILSKLSQGQNSIFSILSYLIFKIPGSFVFIFLIFTFNDYNLLWVTLGSLLHCMTTIMGFGLFPYNQPSTTCIWSLFFCPFWANFHVTSLCLHFTLFVFDYDFSLPRSLNSEPTLQGIVHCSHPTQQACFTHWLICPLAFIYSLAKMYAPNYDLENYSVLLKKGQLHLTFPLSLAMSLFLRKKLVQDLFFINTHLSLRFSSEGLISYSFLLS